MIEILDWQKVIGLPNDILHQAGEHLEFADLLSERACKGVNTGSNPLWTTIFEIKFELC